jgi:hypothetical protein
VLPRASYTNYLLPHPTGTRAERALRLLPTAHWSPRLIVKSFGALMTSRCRQYYALSFADVVITCLLALTIGLGVGTKGASCTVAPLIIAAVYFAYAAVLVVLRPFRLFSDGVMAPIAAALFGGMCVCKYAESDTAVLETLLSVVQVTQMLLRLWVMFREWQWRALVPEPEGHAAAARESKLTSMQQELEDISLGDVEIGSLGERTTAGGGGTVAFVDEDGVPIHLPSSEDESDEEPLTLVACPLAVVAVEEEKINTRRKRPPFSKRNPRMQATAGGQPPARTRGCAGRRHRSMMAPDGGLLMYGDDDAAAPLEGDDASECGASERQHHTTLFFNEV